MQIKFHLKALIFNVYDIFVGKILFTCRDLFYLDVDLCVDLRIPGSELLFFNSDQWEYYLSILLFSCQSSQNKTLPQSF